VKIYDYGEWQRDAVEDAGVNGWRPIETAPTDHVTVLIYDGSEVATASYWAGCWRDDHGVDFIPQPTHWMPLPEPPK
jgi:hypothetical protein